MGKVTFGFWWLVGVVFGFWWLVIVVFIRIGLKKIGIGVVGILILIPICLVIADNLGWIEPDPIWYCLDGVREKTERLKFSGTFSSQYAEDTYRRQQEALCRILYD